MSDDILKFLKDAFKNRDKNKINVLANSIKKGYKDMTKEQIKEFGDFVKQEFTPMKVTEDRINNIKSLYNNKKLLNEVNNPVKNPLAIKEIDKLNSGLMSSIRKNIKEEITKGEEYFQGVKDLLLNENKEIKDLGVFGDVVNALEGTELDNDTKKLLRKQLGIDNGIQLENHLSVRNKEDFISKTFKGDSKKEEDVAEYLSKMDAYLGIGGKDTEMYQEMKNIVDDRGNLLRKQQEYETRKIEKEIKRNQNKNNSSNKTNKEAKINKKLEKKEMKALREATGTEGGTLTDFFKGGRGNALNIGLSAIGAVAEYKEGRNEGKTVLGSAADAAVSFVAGEVLGWTGMLTIGAVKGATTLGLKGAKYAVESSRSMNNIQRFTPFADAQFQDTQQLATMRQSGMELAKMSQYNLQQTLMGTEARHLHR